MKYSKFSWLVVVVVTLLFLGQSIVLADDPFKMPKWSTDCMIASMLYNRGMCESSTDLKAAEANLALAQQYIAKAISEGAPKGAMQLDQAISKSLVALETAKITPTPVAAAAPSVRQQPAIVRGRSVVMRVR